MYILLKILWIWNTGLSLEYFILIYWYFYSVKDLNTSSRTGLIMSDFPGEGEIKHTMKSSHTV